MIISASRVGAFTATAALSLAALTGCSSSDDTTPSESGSETASAVADSTAGSETDADDRSAAQRAADDCDPSHGEFTVEGEVLSLRIPFADMEAFDADVWECVADAGLPIAEDIGMDDDDNMDVLHMFTTDGYVVTGDDLFARVTAWDGDSQFEDIGPLLALGANADDSENPDIPDSWTVQMQIGPDDGTYPPTSGGSSSSADDDSTSDAELGSRSEPLALGSKAVLGPVEVSVDAVNPDAVEQVMAANEFNDEPADGYVYVLSSVTVTNVSDDDDHTFSPLMDLSFKAIAASGETYDQEFQSIDNALSDLSEMYPGGTGTGDVLFSVPKSAVDGLVIRVNEAWEFDDVSAFFATK